MFGLINIALVMLIASMPFTCTSCITDIDIAFEVTNAMNTSRHDIIVDISGPGIVERLGIFEHGRHEVFLKTFEVSHSKQRTVRVNFTITDLVTGGVIVKRDIQLTIDRTIALVITDRDFGR